MFRHLYRSCRINYGVLSYEQNQTTLRDNLIHPPWYCRLVTRECNCCWFPFVWLPLEMNMPQVWCLKWLNRSLVNINQHIASSRTHCVFAYTLKFPQQTQRSCLMMVDGCEKKYNQSKSSKHPWPRWVFHSVIILRKVQFVSILRAIQ